jgi:hypothetical protein
MKRFTVAVVVAMVSTLLMAGPVSAGEITGHGKQTPIKAWQSPEAPAGPASSFCAFSGLNDDPDEAGLFEDGRVQSFGDIVQEAIDVLGDGKGASALVPIIRADGPGVNCRGNAGGDGH